MIKMIFLAAKRPKICIHLIRENSWNSWQKNRHRLKNHFNHLICGKKKKKKKSAITRLIR